MKKLGVVLQYELMTYIKNKSYVISTVHHTSIRYTAEKPAYMRV